MDWSAPGWVLAYLAFYFSVAFLLFLYGMHAYVMAFLFRPGAAPASSPPEPAILPMVTVQLPLFNERYVARRLIDAVASFDYPKDRLQVQVLDDSTDDTVSEVGEAVERWRLRGIDIEHRRRTGRAGWKGGALREGLAEARGNLVAVFDADFLPPNDFLRRVVTHFEDPAVGMVQARWTHLNEDYSVLTRAQAAALDGHFLIEHSVRNRKKAFINFNGTAGVWRRRAIEDAGNWQDDTLTEDLDLSYRAQLRGWKFLFLPGVTCPAELPAEVNGLKGQQFRWAKGSMQTGMKILPALFRAELPWFTKFQGLVHLTNHAVYPLLILIALAIVPALVILDRYPSVDLAFQAATLLVVASFGHPWLYLLARRARGKSWMESVLVLPAVVAGNMGIAINNTRGLVEAFRGVRSGFDRTPKYALVNRSESWEGKRYRVPVSAWAVAEVLLALYALAGIAYACSHAHYLAVPFLLLYVAGCGYVGLSSLANGIASARELRRSRSSAPGSLAPALVQHD